MKFIAKGPKKDAPDTLVWSGKWEGLQWVLMSTAPVVLAGSRLTGDGPPWLSIIGFAVAVGFFFGGPKRRVTFDMRLREIRVKPEGLFSQGNEKTIKFDEIQELVVSDRPQKPRELVLRSPEGDIDLIGLHRVYANEQALGELRTAFIARQ